MHSCTKKWFLLLCLPGLGGRLSPAQVLPRLKVMSDAVVVLLELDSSFMANNFLHGKAKYLNFGGSPY